MVFIIGIDPCGVCDKPGRKRMKEAPSDSIVGQLNSTVASAGAIRKAGR
jgi:hypothetical protein